MKEIPLSQGLVATIDDEDFDRVSQHKWWIQKSRGHAYAITYTVIDGQRRFLALHRFIMNVSDKNVLVSFKDCNTFNCMKDNLVLQPDQAKRGHKLHKNNKTGYKGVYIDKDKVAHPYVANITVGGKSYKLGYFATAHEAAAAYDEAAREHFGDLAVLNSDIVDG